MNENCCLCKCITELYFFYWFLVVSLAVVIVTCAVCFQSFINIAYTKCRAYQTLFKINWLHIVIKSLNEKNKHDKFFIMLKRTSVNVDSNTGLRSHWKFFQKWEPAGRIGDFGNFLNGFAKCPRLIVLNIDWVQFFLKNCEIVHPVRGLYDQ